jgi:hypothetical protein
MDVSQISHKQYTNQQKHLIEYNEMQRIKFKTSILLSTSAGWYTDCTNTDCNNTDCNNTDCTNTHGKSNIKFANFVQNF